MTPTPNNLAAYCWSIADLLRGDFKQSQYGRIILPFTLLRRLECVLEPGKEKVLGEHRNIRPMKLPEAAEEKLLLRAAGLSFFNTSKMDLSKLGEADIKDNLENYIQGFSRDAREIFDYFNFAEFIGQLNDADLLYKVVQKVRQTDLSPAGPDNPNGISNHDMGLVFEELIRRFAEGSNETAGEHFTPRDIVRLTTALVFMEDDDALTSPGIIRTIYDPTAGTGGFLSSGMEYVHELNPRAVMRAFGQELNPESYAICKADMLIKGQDVSHIKLGNTLPNDMFYNTGIATYVWVLSNKKAGERKGNVQLINGVNLCGKMRKSLGSKRKQMNDEDIATITRTFGAYEVVAARALDKPAEQKSNRGRQAANPKTEAGKTFASKIFATHAFGYRRITIERPLRQSYQFSDQRIDPLRYAAKPLHAPMQWIAETYGSDWADHQPAIRKHLKSHFSDLKEAKIKTLLDPNTWQSCEAIYQQARALQAVIGTAQHDDSNGFDHTLKQACAQLDITLDTKAKKAITAAVCWKNPEAEKVIRRSSASMPPRHTGHPDHKKNSPALYGIYKVGDHYVEYRADGDLRDHENVALDPSLAVDTLNEAYFKKEVLPHVPDAWIDPGKKDPKDQQVGIVGYEIPFNRHFYQYQPPRPLEEIDADLDRVSAEIMELLREVHS